MTPPQVTAEISIEWLRPPESVAAYLREKIRPHRSPQGRPTLGVTEGELIAYAVLDSDTKPARRGRHHPRYARRVWYVAPCDPYEPGPGEAVVPASVAPGRESEPWIGGGGHS